MKEQSKTPYIDAIVDTYIEKVREFYPSLEFGSRRSMLFSSSEPSTCDFEFRFNSFNLNNTEYQATRNYDLIHYTSNVQNVLDILNSGVIRLSNLISLNDPQEINFIVNNLQMKFNVDQIEAYKNHYFTASFCKITNNKKPDSFPMWRLYGGDGLGAAIVFEVVNPKNEWTNFLLANVQYGNSKAVDRFKNLWSFHNNFQQEKNHPIQNFPKALSALMALHKNQIWAYEKEIRLLTHHNFDKYTLKEQDSHICNLKHSITRQGTKYAFVELPLFNCPEYVRFEKILDKEQLYRFIPILKVKKIILGYKHDYNICHDIGDIIQSLSHKYKNHIELNVSHLREQMI